MKEDQCLGATHIEFEDGFADRQTVQRLGGLGNHHGGIGFGTDLIVARRLEDRIGRRDR